MSESVLCFSFGTGRAAGHPPKIRLSSRSRVAIMGGGPNMRAMGEVCVFSVDKRNLMWWIYKDPTLIYRMILAFSKRIRDVNAQITSLEHSLAAPSGKQNEA